MDALGALFGMRGKVALITGAGAGLGREFSLCLAEAGAEVIAADRQVERAAETAALVRAAGYECAAMQLDVADAASVEKMAATLAKRDRLDVLINNAGIAAMSRRTHELSPEAWDEVIGINLTGAFLCSRAAIPPMLAGGGGSIINISSILGLGGHYPGFSMASAAYGAAKAGLIGLTRQIAVEYATDNIRANAIAPGWHGGTRISERFRSDRSNHLMAERERAIADGTPMGRRGQPEELRGLVLYLASDASSFVTGQVIASDGGWTAQ